MHDHDWQPIPLEFGRYACACSATGYRNSLGQIVEHKTKLRRQPEITARGYRDHDGRIRSKPTNRDGTNDE